MLGEGAGVLMLEELERAKKRGATIYAEILGLGSSFDAYTATQPDPEGRGAARAIAEALREARIDHHDVDYINAHGTSTRLNDRMETAAVKRVFGEGARALPMSSIKSMVGHLIGAAGAVEAIAMALTLASGVLPPTINQTQPDPECDLDYVPNTARDTEVARGRFDQLRLRRAERGPGDAALRGLTLTTSFAADMFAFLGDGAFHERHHENKSESQNGEHIEDVEVGERGRLLGTEFLEPLQGQ